MARESEQSLFGYMFARYLALDVIVGFSLTVLWLTSYETRQLGGAIVLCASLFLLRFAAWTLYLQRALQPVAAWRQNPTAFDSRALFELELSLLRLPSRLGIVLVLGWAAYFSVLPLLAWTLFPELVELGKAELPAMVMQILAVLLGSHGLYVQLTTIMIDGTLAELDGALAERAGDRLRPRSPLVPRLVLVGVQLVFAPILWLGSMTWLGDVHDARQLTTTELSVAVELGVRELEAGRPLEPILELVGAPPGELEGGRGSGIDVRHDRAWAAAATHDGRWLLARREIGYPTLRFFGLLALFCFALLVWGASTIFAQARAIMLPVQRLRDAVRRMVEVGDLGAMSRIPTIGNDEIGDLTEDFNRVLATYKQLARIADAVAHGELALEITGQGDLPEAFRRMLDQLHDVVVQLRVTAASLGEATAAIQAAMREQESATERQVTEIRHLDQSMASLAGSALQVEQASTRVLEIAEQSLANTDEMVAKIRTLAQHNDAIEGLLELVREIAGRSDLLALNGALEATRAGEAGRGFTLVAAEMRRLAERITQIVANMRSLVADIERSSASTVLSTERGRTLVRNTAEAARAITDEARRQAADTERASSNMAQVASILAETSAATSQTCEIAETLDLRADQLEQVLAGFELREPIQDQRATRSASNPK